MQQGTKDLNINHIKESLSDFVFQTQPLCRWRTLDYYSEQ